MPKTKTKTSRLGLRPKLKFDKTLLAVIALVVVVTGGYVFYRGTQAATAPFASYNYLSPPMYHQTGGLNPNRAVVLGGTRMNVRTWEWDTTRPDSKTLFLQFGPYRNINIPSGYSGLHVCYYYAATNDAGHAGTIRVYHDLTFVGAGTNNRVTYLPPNHPQPENVNEDALSSGYMVLRPHCFNYGFGIRNLNYVEFRLKVVGGSDAYSHLSLFKTTVALY